MSVPQNQLNWNNYRGISHLYENQAAPASSFDEPDDVEWADYAKSIMAGGASLVQATGWLANVLGAEDIGDSIETLGRDAVDYWNDSLSDPAKAEISKEIIRKNEQTGEYEWGDPSFSTVGLMGAQSLLGTAAGMGIGAGLTKVLQVFANPFGRKVLTSAVTAGKTEGAALDVVRKGVAAGRKLKIVDMALGGTGFGLGEGFVGGISAGASVYDNIMNLDHEKLMENPRYQEVYDSTDSSISELERHQYAADTVAKEASSAAGWQSGFTTALLGAPMGAYFGRILGGAKLSSTLTRGIATGAAGEAAQEFAQSGVEQYISNIRTQPFDPSIDDFDGVLNAAVAGFLAGGLLGGVVGPASVKGAKYEIADEARNKKVESMIGDELIPAAQSAAKAGAGEVTIMEIVHDATERRIEPEDAIDNLVALTKEKETGEQPTARAAPPAIPDDNTERKKLNQAELSDMMEEVAGGIIDVETLNPATLQVDSELMQFKQSDEKGVTGALKGVTKFEQVKAGIAIVWERLDKVRFVANGHQRVDLANRAIEGGQDPATVRMQAFILREADGVTPEMARNIAAIANIAEGSGSPLDAAKVMREMGPAADEVIANLPPNSPLVKQGKGLAKLDEEAFGKAANEVIEIPHAALVGEMISDGPLQNAAIEVLRKTEPANAAQARAIIADVRAIGAETTMTEDLFGEQAMTESLYLERAKVLDSAQRIARRNKATFKTLTNREKSITGTGKNKLDRAANEAAIGDADAVLTALLTAANVKGPVSDALTEAARRVKAGEKPGKVSGDFLTAALSAVKGPSKAGDKAGTGKPKAKGAEPVAEPALLSRKGYPIAPREQWSGEADFEARDGKLVEMTPDEFLAKAAPLTVDEVSRENIDDLKRHIQEGGELDPLTLYPGTRARDSDGRHRAIAAKELGIESLPVVSFTGEEQDLYSRRGPGATIDRGLTPTTSKFLEQEVLNPIQMGEMSRADNPGFALLADSINLGENHITLPDNPAALAAVGEALDQVILAMQSDLSGRNQYRYGGVNREVTELKAGIRAMQTLRRQADEGSKRAPLSSETQEDMFGAPAVPEPVQQPVQESLFSRPGIPLGEIRLMREMEIEETGEVVEVEQNAEVLLRQHDKRTGMVQELRTCIRG